MLSSQVASSAHGHIGSPPRASARVLTIGVVEPWSRAHRLAIHGTALSRRSLLSHCRRSRSTPFRDFIPRRHRAEVGTAVGSFRRHLPHLLPRPGRPAGMTRHPRRDVIAGLTVAVVALPLALAFGVSSGLGAEPTDHRAWSPGRSRPSSAAAISRSADHWAMTVVLVPIVAATARSRPRGRAHGRHVPHRSGVRRRGRTMRYIPLPSSRFTIGIAVIIGLQQVADALGQDGSISHATALFAAAEAFTSWFSDPGWAATGGSPCSSRSPCSRPRAFDRAAHLAHRRRARDGGRGGHRPAGRDDRVDPRRTTPAAPPRLRRDRHREARAAGRGDRSAGRAGEPPVRDGRRRHARG